MYYEASDQGKNKTLWMVLGVLALLLIVCCCVLVIAGGLLYFNSDGGAIYLPFGGPNLSETFTSDDDHSVSFNYPEGWYADGEGGSYYAATFRNPGNLKNVEAEDIYLSMYLQSDEWLPADSSKKILQTVIENLESVETDLEFSDIDSIQIGDYDGVYCKIRGYYEAVDADIEGMLIVWEMQSGLFGQAISLSGEEQFTDYEAIITGILESLDPGDLEEADSLPNPLFAGNYLGATFYSDDDYNVVFNYPEDWYAEGDYGDYYIGTIRDVEDMYEPEPGEFYMNIYFDGKEWYDGDTPEEILEELLSYLDDDDFEVSAIQTTRVGDKDAAYFTMTGDILSVDVDVEGMVVIWDVDDDYFGQTIGFSTQGDFSQYRSAMEAILDSLTADLDY